MQKEDGVQFTTIIVSVWRGIAKGYQRDIKINRDNFRKGANMTIGKHEKIDVLKIPSALSGDCFHGEVWVRCPHCKTAHEMVSSTPIKKKDGYRIYRCSCGELFKDR